MVPGDVMPGGFAVGRARRWVIPEGWEIPDGFDVGWDADLVLGNEASDPDFVVPLEHAIPVAMEDRPWLAYQFEEGGVTYNVWRVNYYKRMPDHEELYDWSECVPCGSSSYNAQRHWVGWDNDCLACYSLQSSDSAGPAPGSDVPSNATTVHFVSVAWSDFFNKYRWFTVRRFRRSAPGGTRAPQWITTFRIQRVFELTREESLGKPSSFPAPTGYGLFP